MAQVPSTYCHEGYYRLSITTSMSKDNKVFWSCKRIGRTKSLKFLKGGSMVAISTYIHPTGIQRHEVKSRTPLKRGAKLLHDFSGSVFFPLAQAGMQPLVSASGKSGSPTRANGIIDVSNVCVEDKNMCYQQIVKDRVSTGFNCICLSIVSSLHHFTSLCVK